MLSRMLAVALAAVSLCMASAKDHPVVKVIGMLEDLAAKAKSQGQDEEVAFDKFSYWCKTSISELKDAIEEEKATIDQLESKIESLKKEKKSLEDAIDELKDKIKELDADAKAAKDAFDKKMKLLTDEEDALKSTIKGVTGAIKALKEAGEKTDSLLQEKAQRSLRAAVALVAVSGSASDSQKELLQQAVSDDPAAMGDRKAHVKKYSFKSDNIIDLLKELKIKFEDDQTANQAEQTNAQNAYSLEKDARQNERDAADKLKGQKEDRLGEVTGDLKTAEGDLKNEKDDLKADSDTLDKTTEACDTKSREWEERSATRAGELEAIAKAIEIMEKVSGVRTKPSDNPVPPPSPIFLQIESDDPKDKAVQLLRATAKSTHSKALEQLAMEVSTHLTGHFTKINDMIQKMIFRLQAEQTDEDKHKAWCDLELDKSEKSKDDKNDKIDDLTRKIKAADAKVATLNNEIKDADKMVADITAFEEEATEIRTIGKKENAISIKDAMEAQTAIANAVAVLETFYKESGKVKKADYESLVQEPVTLPDNPSTWDAGYTGAADPKNAENGVIAMLEKIATDFSKMEADSKAQEVEDQKVYDEQMKAHEIEKTRRQDESDAKVAQKKRTLEKIASMTKQKKVTTDELDAVKQYLKDLQPACVDGDSSYEDRKKARGKEIDALKKAQDLLRNAFKGSASAFLEVRRHTTF